MLYRHIWSIVCKTSKIDRDTNNVSLIDSLEEVQFDFNTEQSTNTSEQPIGTPFSFDVVSLFYRDKKGKQATLRYLMQVVDPSGKILGNFGNNVIFEPHQGRARNVVHSEMIALTTSGTYIFQIHISDDKDHDKLNQVASIPIDITLRINGRAV